MRAPCLRCRKPDKRVDAATQMVGMTVRQAEALRKRLNKKPVQKPENAGFSVDYLSGSGARAGKRARPQGRIQQGKTSGTLTLEYYGADDLERLIEALRGLRV